MGDEEGTTKTTNKERRRTKRQRENGSQTDDETLQDGGATMWQKEVNKQLDSLLTIVPLIEELREELKMMKEENKSLHSNCAKVGKRRDRSSETEPNECCRGTE